MLALYRAATAVSGPLLALHLARRARSGKEDPARLGERQGRPSLPRPPGALVWLHGASVGEALSLLPVIGHLRERYPTLTPLLTTGTLTSARLMAERLPKGALHQFLPLDHPRWVGRFLDHWRPALVLWAESELWPNTLHQINKINIPAILLNGRISSRSFAKWRRFPRSAAALLKTFSLCCAQSEEDVERLRLLGAAQVEHLGNLKSAAPPLPADPVRLDSLRAACAGRPVWCAVSTHAGEELTIGRIHRTLAQSLPNLLTIIAPRHPERGALVAGELESLGLRVSRRGQGGMPQGETGVYIADTVGELGLFFRVCPVVFMGKSLVPLGGQNPLEPARLGCVVLFGPFMDNFAEIARRMIAQGAAIPVQDAEELTAQVHSLLTDQEKILEFSRKSKNFTDLEAKVLDRILKHLAPFLLAAETGALVDDASHARA